MKLDWKLFRPTKRKLIVTVILMIAWIIFLNIYAAVMCKCSIGGFENCNDYFYLALVKNLTCHCSCIPLTEIVVQYLWVLVIPFILVYAAYSLIEPVISKNKK